MISSPAGSGGGELASALDAELGEHVREVRLHGVARDEELLGDLTVGEAAFDLFDDEPLGGGEALPPERRALAFTPDPLGVLDR